MMTISKVLAAVSVLALAAGAYSAMPVQAQDEAITATVLKEGKGAAFDVGTKRAVAYYRNEHGACKVSVAVSETYPEQIPYNLASVRFAASVAAGTTAEVETSDGAMLMLSCAKGAQSLKVESADMVAWAARAIN